LKQRKDFSHIKTDLFLDAFFGNVFPPKGAEQNSQKWGVWGGGFRGLGFIYIYIFPVIYKSKK